MSDIVHIEIDGQAFEAPRGAMVIQVADEHGIYIPRFCYHHKLSIAANCRMCLVEVEKAPKPLPACATPVTEGMKVLTRSSRALAAQKATMEFLLINHPLDCPVCDQGGECELQDLALAYGRSHSRYDQRKRVVADDDIGPLVSTDMTRCIYCSRCVRFSHEVAGVTELGILGRGEHSEVRTALRGALSSEVSANIIDLCPVGALNSKPFRFRARSWEMLALPGLALHDGLGTHLYAHTLRGRLMRVVPREAEDINEIWLADRDRFSYLGLEQDRVRQPLVREGTTLRPVEWEEALDRAAVLLEKTVQEQGADTVAILASPSASLEEGALLLRLGRRLGVTGIDHRLWRAGPGSGLSPEPSLAIAVRDFASPRSILMAGCYLRHELPLLNLRVRRAVLAGARVHALNPCAWPWNYPVCTNPALGSEGFGSALAAILRVALRRRGLAVPESVDRRATGCPLNDRVVQGIVDDLSQESAAIVVGEVLLLHPHADELMDVTRLIAQHTGASFSIVAPGANARGLHRLGLLPTQAPFDPWASNLRLRLLFGFQPEYDVGATARALRALEETASIHVTSHLGPEAARTATVVLPLATPFETAGSWLSLEGRLQETHAMVPPPQGVRPGWMILRDLGRRLGGAPADFPDDFLKVVTLRSPLPGASAAPAPRVPELRHEPRSSKGLVVIRTRAPHAADALLRHAPALQETPLGRAAAVVAIHPDDARELGLHDEDRERLELRDSHGHAARVGWRVDLAVPKGHVHLPLGSPSLDEAAFLEGMTVEPRAIVVDVEAVGT